MDYFEKLDAIFEKSEEVLKGGLADDQDLDDIAKEHGVDKEDIYKEFKKGLEVEKEHSDDMRKSVEIAKDHLKEDPKYYTKLAKIEDK
jgi:predicted DNA-binding protein YlxM (UPF0122 family)